MLQIHCVFMHLSSRPPVLHESGEHRCQNSLFFAANSRVRRHDVAAEMSTHILLSRQNPYRVNLFGEKFKMVFGGQAQKVQRCKGAKVQLFCTLMLYSFVRFGHVFVKVQNGIWGLPIRPCQPRPRPKKCKKCKKYKNCKKMSEKYRKRCPRGTHKIYQQ